MSRSESTEIPKGRRWQPKRADMLKLESRTPTVNCLGKKDKHKSHKSTRAEQANTATNAERQMKENEGRDEGRKRFESKEIRKRAGMATEKGRTCLKKENLGPNSELFRGRRDFKMVSFRTKQKTNASASGLILRLFPLPI